MTGLCGVVAGNGSADVVEASCNADGRLRDEDLSLGIRGTGFRAIDFVVVGWIFCGADIWVGVRNLVLLDLKLKEGDPLSIEDGVLCSLEDIHKLWPVKWSNKTNSKGNDHT